jgi:hypothetical protein
MANILSNSGIVNGQQITVNEITQIIDVFTATTPSDVNLNGELFTTGSGTTITAYGGFTGGKLVGIATTAISASSALTGPLIYTSASYALTSSVFAPLKTNIVVGTSSLYPTGLISGYGQIPANSAKTTITGLTELIGKGMDTTGRSGSVFVAMGTYPKGNDFNPNNVIIPYSLSGSDLTFQTRNGNIVSDPVDFNYIITYA